MISSARGQAVFFKIWTDNVNEAEKLWALEEVLGRTSRAKAEGGALSKVPWFCASGASEQLAAPFPPLEKHGTHSTMFRDEGPPPSLDMWEKPLKKE